LTLSTYILFVYIHFIYYSIGNIVKGQHEAQMMDRLQVERERGITVKAQTATLVYTFKGEDYLLNLIDTPGHVDFS